MPGKESGGVGNFWYSFDYGMAHFVSLDGETDFAKSPESPFLRDTNGNGDKPTENQTYVTNSGPFGTIDNNQYLNNSAYQQIQWLKQDLARVDRKKTPWVIAMSHRPMYSTEVAAYQANIRNAFEAILLDAGVDMYLAGHIHWYERNWPLTLNGTVDRAAIIDNNTYAVNPGKSLVHITNGMAGNIESHSFIKDGTPIRDTTAVLNQLDYGFSKLTFKDVNTLTWEFVKGDGSGIGDSLTLRKKSSSSAAAPASYRGRESGPAIWQWPWGGRRNWMM
jgi:acid phosphatase